jgi:hypothetical protein
MAASRGGCRIPRRVRKSKPALDKAADGVESVLVCISRMRCVQTMRCEMWEPQIVLPGERGTRLLWAAATAKKTASIAQSTFVVSMMLLLVSDKSFM